MFDLKIKSSNFAPKPNGFGAIGVFGAERAKSDDFARGSGVNLVIDSCVLSNTKR